MGGSESKEPEVRYETKYETKEVYVESEESKKFKELMRTDRQIDEMKQEVFSLDPLITKGIKETICKEENVTIVEYKDLRDKEKMIRNVETLFTNFPHKKFLVETAQAMVEAMATTKEMSHLMRWHNREVVINKDSKVIGLEIQYKLKLYDASKGGSRAGYFFGGVPKETVLIIAYKCMAHTMDKAADDVLTTQELKELEF